EAATQDAAEKAQAKSQREELEAQPEPKFVNPGFDGFNWDDPGYFVHVLADLLTSLFVNLLMLISGIGLIALKRWGRALAIWPAVFKIARLVVVTASLILVVAPFFVRFFNDLQAIAVKQDAGAGVQVDVKVGAAAQTPDGKSVGLLVCSYAV